MAGTGYPAHLQSGKQGESAAAEFVQTQGLIIIEKNFRSKRGEIDLIAKDGEYIVFIEVRLRQVNSLVSALESITPQKQKNIHHTALYYLQKNQLLEKHRCRFDIITVEPKREQLDCTWLKNAF